MEAILSAALWAGAFLFVLGWCTVGAAAGHMSRTRHRRFPLGRCALAALLPAAVAFGLPWLFDPPDRAGVLAVLWVVAFATSVWPGGRL